MGLRLKRLEALVGRRRAAGRGAAGGKVNDEPEHVLEVLRVLRDAGALRDVLKDEGLELAALELLDAT